MFSKKVLTVVTALFFLLQVISGKNTCELTGNTKTMVVNGESLSIWPEGETTILKNAQISCNIHRTFSNGLPSINGFGCLSKEFFFQIFKGQVTEGFSSLKAETMQYKYDKELATFQFALEGFNIHGAMDKLSENLNITISSSKKEEFTGICSKRWSKTEKFLELTQVHFDWSKHVTRLVTSDIRTFCFCLASILLLIFMNNWDEMKEAEFVRYVQKIRTPLNDKIALIVRFIITNEFFIFLNPTLLFLAPTKPAYAFVLASAVGELANGVVKWMYQRPRPFWVTKGVANVGKIWEQDYSFPSSHASSSGSCITMLLLTFDTSFYGFLLVFFSFLVGLSRIYLGVHSLSHVIVGWVLGITTSLLLHSFDVVDWFTLLEEQDKLKLAVLIPILVYSTFYMLKIVFPDPNSKVISNWEENAIHNTDANTQKKSFLEPRSLNKYDFQIWSVVGSILGSVISINFAKKGYLRYIDETRSWDCIGSLMGRYVVGLSVIAMFFYLIFILSPTLIKKSVILGNSFKMASMLLLGLWITFGNGYVSYKLFGFECPTFDCKATKPRDSSNVFQHESLNFKYSNCSMVLITPDVLKHPEQLHPKNVFELSNLIKMAHQNKRVIRATGSFHSYPTQLHNPNYDTKVQFVSLRHFRDYKLVEENGVKYVIAGAGICLGENPYNPGCERNNSLTDRMWEDGLAVPHLSGISFQTLSGLLMTDSQGGSVKYQLKDSVIGYRWINGLGEQREAWKNATDLHEFNAFGVSMGLAGVLYQVILKPEPRYCLDVWTRQYEDTFKKNVNTNKNVIEEILLGNETDYVRAFVFGGMDQNMNWKLSSHFTNARRLPLHFNETHNCGGLIKKGKETFDPYPRSIFHAVMGAESMELQYDECKQVYGKNICEASLFTRALDGSENREQKIKVERCIKTISERFTEPKQKYDSNYVKLYGPPPETLAACWVDVMDELDDVHQYGKYHLQLVFDDQTETHSNQLIIQSELVFPTDTNNATDVLDAFHEFWTTHYNKFASILVHWELYSCPASPLYMSPCYGSPAIRLCFFHSVRNKPEDSAQKEAFETIWNFFYSRGFKLRLHWGKATPAWLPGLSTDLMKDIVNSYPKLNDFRDFVSKEDPNHVFLSSYWERTGIIQV
jgi:membrane-associated phospholipid phosphatase